MSDTPRTDAAILDVLQSGQHYKVKAEFARQLEREVVELDQRIESLITQFCRNIAEGENLLQAEEDRRFAAEDELKLLRDQIKTNP